MILLVGGKGSIGRRYQAILQYFNEPYHVFDFPHSVKRKLPRFDKAIIASPTSTHGEYCEEISSLGKPYLCEKPLCFDPLEAEHIAWQWGKDGFVVNNYAFLKTAPEFQHPKMISYDFYNTGRDGLIWDVCQLVYLAKLSKAELSVKRKSWTWTLELDDWRVPYQTIEVSYMQMVRAFLLDQRDSLWSVQKGVEMTKLCKELSGRGGDCEAFNWNPSTDEFKAFSKEDLSADRR